MRAREFERLLEDLSPWGASEIDQTTRALRSVGALPIGGRGLNAPEIDAAHAAAILLSLAGAARSADAKRVRTVYAPMHLVEGEHPYVEPELFGTVLAEIISDPRNRAGVEAVVICRTWPEAEVKYRRRRGGRLMSATYRPHGTPAQGYGKAAREDVTLSGGLLHQVAIELAGNDGAGEQVDG